MGHYSPGEGEKNGERETQGAVSGRNSGEVGCRASANAGTTYDIAPHIAAPIGKEAQVNVSSVTCIRHMYLTLFYSHRSDFRESTDGRAIVATFELLDVAKEDIHVSFQRNKLVITWETAELNEWDEDGAVLREYIRNTHHRTLPLPEGTRVRSMDSNYMFH